MEDMELEPPISKHKPSRILSFSFLSIAFTLGFYLCYWLNWGMAGRVRQIEGFPFIQRGFALTFNGQYHECYAPRDGELHVRPEDH